MCIFRERERGRLDLNSIEENKACLSLLVCCNFCDLNNQISAPTAVARS